MKSTIIAAVSLALAAIAPAQQTTSPRSDILALAQGTVVISVSSSYGGSWTAANIADGSTGTGWSSAQGAAFPHTVVFELARPYAIASVAVDNTGDQEGSYPGISSRRVTVYGSTTSFATGFTQLTAFEARRGGRTEVTLAARVKARWLKFVVTSNWGNAEYTEIMELEAYGKPVAPPPTVDVSAGQVAPPAPTVRPGEGAWANYDFVPGDRVIFFDDFTSDNAGDFPRRFEFKSGNMEVVEWQGGRYLRNRGEPGRFVIPLPEVLPDRFTIEFDYSNTDPAPNPLELSFAQGNGLSYIVFYPDGGGVQGAVTSDGHEPSASKQVFRARVMADGRYVKVYVNGTRVGNAPNANLGRAAWLAVELPGCCGTQLFGNITVAAGGKKLYDALAEQGRVATHGILFDTGSDRLRPESTPTLKQIGEMLTQHADLKLTIEGHTDDVGGDAANQTLSEKRAAAVKQYLVSTYSIDAGRLATKGFGASKPASPNTTPEGRQNNRRVELVKM